MVQCKQLLRVERSQPMPGPLAIPIEDVEDHDLEWLEKWIAETETVPRTS
jgi:hypothetical protein